MGALTHVFVDESKNKDYLLIAAFTSSRSQQELRQHMRSLLLPNQNRIHMKTERDSRRREILDTIVSLGVRVDIFKVETGKGKRTQVEARADVLKCLVRQMLDEKATYLCLETDETMDRRDRQVIAQYLREQRQADAIQYRHMPAKSEILLCIPDAVGWAWGRGGLWKKKVQSIVTEHRVY